MFSFGLTLISVIRACCNIVSTLASPGTIPMHSQRELRESIRKTLDLDGILPPATECADPIVHFSRLDDTLRLCVDYYRLNSVTRRGLFPFPHTEQTLDNLGNSDNFASPDLASRYWHVESPPDDQCRSVYEFQSMTFGF